MPHVRDAKTILRAEALRRREAVEPSVRMALALGLRDAGPGLVRRIHPWVRVAGYLPIGSEADTTLLLAALEEAEVELALPVTPARGEPLRFRSFHSTVALVPGRHGTREPPPSATEVEPDILFVPLLAFDRRGGRLGYGAGFYDGALRRLRGGKTVFAIGVAFADQEVAAVPTDPHDSPLDAVFTERGLTVFGG